MNNQFEINAVKDPVVIYHANCLDGVMSAIIMLENLKYQGFEDVKTIPWTHGRSEANDKFLGSMVDKDVFWVDVCPSHETIKDLLIVVNQLVILDHHASNIEEVKGTPFEGCIDISYSGAGLTWRFWCEVNNRPDRELPPVVARVQDRDLWTWKLENTGAITQSLGLLGLTLEGVKERLMLPYNELLAQGEALAVKQETEELRTSKQAWDYVIAGKPAKCVCCSPVFASGAGNLMAKESESNIAVLYYDRGDGRNFSMRSIGDVDVSVIAKAFGGGGHKNAAGFFLADDDPQYHHSHQYLELPKE